MPVYVFRCEDCLDEIETIFPIGKQPARYFCDCGGTMVQRLGVGLYISADATPNKRASVREIQQTEDRWGREESSFKRMHKAGLTPPLNGCDLIEDKVGDQTDIDYRLFTDEAKSVKPQIREVEEALVPTHPKAS